ncbi:GNAT family N-acetyltransferase [Lentzea sp. NPDC051213]|uniref:GNAT family N-acetyltransferase n=1 Tax=Lentzea sp. NPDC051213 TaxID=3364126 RepID=UPI0037BCCC48
MTIRLAVASDASAVASVHVRSWQSAYRGLIPDSVLDNLSVEARTAGWEEYIASGSVWVGLAPASGEIVGFAFAGESRDDDAPFELYTIYLLPSAWGSGLALELVAAAIGDEKDVIVWVLDGNARARRFYERLGFRVDGATRTQTVGSAVLEEVRYRTAAG